MFPRLGFGEIALIVFIALLVFGPGKLPQLGKSVGQAIREFRSSMRGASAVQDGDSTAGER